MGYSLTGYSWEVLTVKVTLELHPEGGRGSELYSHLWEGCCKTEGISGAKVLRPREFGGPHEARETRMEGVRKGGRGEKDSKMMGQIVQGLVTIAPLWMRF